MYHFMRSLYEALVFFGTEMSPSLELYLGIDTPCVVDKFTAISHRPIRAQLNKSAAHNYTRGTGLILSLKSGTSERVYEKQCKCLAVSWLSDHPGEQTHILYGSHNLLEITNIIEAHDLLSHELELNMFNKLQRMLENKIVTWDSKMIDALSILINNDLCLQQLNNKCITEYGKKLFTAYCKNKNMVEITIKNISAMPKRLYSALFVRKSQK
eukprot:180423_1